MASYNDALNSAQDSRSAAFLYRRWRVFMPPYSQSAVDKAAVEKAYDAVFQELKFHVNFTIAELVVMAPKWAYVRTNSAGATDHHSTGKTTAEVNRELFIFKKSDDGTWGIAATASRRQNHPLSKRCSRIYAWRSQMEFE